MTNSSPPAAADDTALLASLLAPLPGAAPAGDVVHEMEIFHTLCEARRDAYPQLSPGIWARTAVFADWATVRRLAVEILQSHSKDLKVAAYFLEADLHLRGFAALAPGLRLLTGLCRNFWSDLHPQSDQDGDHSARFAAIAWVNSKLPGVLAELPVSGEATSPSDSLRDAETALTGLEKILADRAGDEAPSCVLLRDRIDRLLRVLETGGPKARPENAAVAPLERPLAEAARAPIASREEAYERLQEVADYLMRTDPHSPVPYILLQAATWGALPLDELASDLARNGGRLSRLLEALGIGRGGTAP